MERNAARGLPGLLLTAAAVAATLVAIPAKAGFNSSGTQTRCPSDMAQIGNSCVDKWEASLVELTDDGHEVAFTPYETPIGHRVRAVSKANVVPQAHISMVEAQRACKASGKRLCHAAEWKTACKGPEHTRYPYGEVRTPNVCND